VTPLGVFCEAIQPLIPIVKKLLPNLKALLFLLGIGFIGYRVVLIGMASHFAEQGKDASAIALKWYPDLPQALVADAENYLEVDSAKAEKLLKLAAIGNPAQGIVYALLAEIREKQGRTDVAERLMMVADQLAPMEGRVQILALNFWFKRGELEKILKHLNVVLRLRTNLQSELFPVLLGLVTDHDTRYATLSFLDQPLDWWPSFFSYAAANADSLEIVRLLYYTPSKYSPGVSTTQRQAFLWRLEKEREWKDMYFVWLDGLSESEMRGLGNLYNGSFELPLSQTGFDWQTPKTAGISVDVPAADGAADEKALRLTFRGQRIQSSPVFQNLFLSSGNYQLRGRVHLKELEGEYGVQWRVNCLGNAPRTLGVTATFAGSSPWREFSLDFEVPSDRCEVQVLELIVAGRVGLDFEVRGEVWFDALTIVKKTDSREIPRNSLTSI
jgi:hypothetical protein